MRDSAREDRPGEIHGNTKKDQREIRDPGKTLQGNSKAEHESVEAGT
jgi:hypothetical protein